ncbi:basic proline-rich protein-like [Felis catus]|uniref:basic proline-rich protein-like n=1 Tax=Felis catus TaxID=9685 RepID=UPI001D19ECFA|nr:basic proline-rich protein-like [Felis catus]
MLGPLIAIEVWVRRRMALRLKKWLFPTSHHLLQGVYTFAPSAGFPSTSFYPTGSRGAVGRDRKGGPVPGAASPAGRQGPPYAPASAWASGRGKTGAPSAGERGGAVFLGADARHRFRAGSTRGGGVGSEAGRRPVRAAAGVGTGKGVQRIPPPGAPPSRLSSASRPPRPRAAPGPAPSPGPPAGRPFLTCAPPAASRSGRRASAAPAPPGPGAAATTAPLLRLSGRSAGWWSSGRPVAGPCSEPPPTAARSRSPGGRPVPPVPRRLPPTARPLRSGAPPRSATPDPGPRTALPPAMRFIAGPRLPLWPGLCLRGHLSPQSH